MPLVSSLLFEASLSSPLPSNPCNMRTEDGGLEPWHTTQTHGVIQDRTKSLTGDFIQPIFLSTFSSPAFLINFLCLSQFPSYESFRGQESFPFKPVSLFLPNTSLCTISHSVVPPISPVDIVWLPNLCNPMDCSPHPHPRFLCPWDFPGKKNGAGCHFLLLDLPDPGSNPRLLFWQADSLPLSHQKSPHQYL